MRKIIEHNLKTLFIFSILLFVFDACGMYAFFKSSSGSTDIYFLNVGQGDSELIVFPEGAHILIDGGPANGRVAQEIGSIFSPWNRTIDLAILTHPEEDQFGGLFDLYSNIQISAFLSSGIQKESDGFRNLRETIHQHDVKEIFLARGDVVRYGDATLKILWPEKNIKKETPVNDAGIVMLFETEGTETLFAGDISNIIEKKLAGDIGDVNILKVPHHGSKYSSTNEFLSILRPEASFIEVGKNSYGHPTAEALQRISDVGSHIFRTDMSGTIRVSLSHGRAVLYASR